VSAASGKSKSVNVYPAAHAGHAIQSEPSKTTDRSVNCFAVDFMFSPIGCGVTPRTDLMLHAAEPTVASMF